MGALAALTGAGLRGRSRLGALVLVLLCAGSSLAVIAGLSVLDLGARTLDRVAREANVAHLVVRTTPEAASRVATDPRLLEVAGPLPFVTADLTAGGEPLTVELTGVADLPSVSTPLVRSGRWLSGDRELVLEPGLADDTGLAPGDTVTLSAGSSDVAATVVGTAVDLTDCAYPQCSARAYASPAIVTALGGSQVQLLARISSAEQAEAVAGDLLRQPGVLGTETWVDTRADFLAVDRIFGSFVTALGVYLMVLVAVVLTASTAARMVARRRELALLKSTGATPGQVTSSVLAEHLAIGAVGVAIGWVLGSLLAPRLVVGVGRVLHTGSPAWSLRHLAVAALVVSVALIVATVVPAVRAGRTPATDVLRDLPSARGATFADRLSSRLRLGPAGVNAVHDATSRPMSTLFAVAALGVAVIGGVTALGIISSMDAAARDPARTGDNWDVIVEPEGATPSEVERAIASTPGIADSYTLTDERATFHDETFRTRAVGGEPPTARFEVGGGRPIERPGEATAGWGFLDEFGLEVGDTITFDLGGQPATVTIVGWHRDTTDSGVTLVWSEAQRRQLEPTSEPDQWRVLTDGTPRDVVHDRLAASLGDGARVRSYEQTTDFGPFVAAMVLLAGIGAVVALLYLASATVTQVRERAREIGVERTLGFTNARLLTERAVAGALVALPAAVAGTALGLVLLRVVSDAITKEIGTGPGFVSQPSWLALLVIGAAAVALAAAAGTAGTLGVLRRSTASLVAQE